MAKLKMKKIEMRGDEIINSAIKDLFSGDFETIDVIKLKDIGNPYIEKIDIEQFN